MKYFNLETVTVTGDLILITTNVPTPPACPVLARRPAPRPTPAWLTILQTILLSLIAWLIAFIDRIEFDPGPLRAIFTYEMIAWLAIGSFFFLAISRRMADVL